ncbi:MAG: class I adenylate-forming enzyme family protein [Actinomycetota bacterium]
MDLERADLLERSLWDVFCEQAHMAPERRFVSDTRKTLTYGETRALAEQVSAWFSERGVSTGTRVVTCLPTGHEWVVIALALARLGALNVLANTRYTARELAHVVRDSEPAVVVHPTVEFRRDFRELVGQALAETHPDGRGAPQTVALDLAGAGIEALCEGHAAIPPAAKTAGDAAIYVIYTSGTTGAPKGSLTRQGAAMFDAFHSGERQQYTADDRLLLFLPMFHCFGAVNGLLNTVTHGASFVLQPTFEPDAVLDAIEREGITAVYGVPTNFIMLSEAHRERVAKGEPPDLSTWRTGVIGGGNIPMDLATYLAEDMGIEGLTNVYGMTEASAIITQSLPSEPLDVRMQTAGAPVPGVELKSRPIAGEGAAGEIMVRGVTLHAGYLGPNGTVHTDHLEDGWLPTGDLGIVDADGRWTIVGRCRDMYKTSGFNVYPLEIETYLLTHPDIADVAVIGVVDPKRLEAGVACVVPTPGSSLTQAEVIEYAAAGLANFKVPSHVVFMDELPRSQATLKVQKHLLREYWLDQERERQD